MKYLVTGGTGFIGRFVIRELLQRPEAVVYGVVRQGSESKLDHIRTELGASPDRLIAIKGDLARTGLGIAETDSHRLRDQIDHVIHLAAI